MQMGRGRDAGWNSSPRSRLLPGSLEVCVWAQGIASQGAGSGHVALSEGEEELRSMNLGPALQQCLRKI